MHIFNDIEEVRQITIAWKIFYNQQRPHEALGNQIVTIVDLDNYELIKEFLLRKTKCLTKSF